MVLDALKFNHKIQANPFAPSKVAFAGNGKESVAKTGVEAYGTGQGINGTNSSGVLGEVTGTGENGKHKLDMYM